MDQLQIDNELGKIRAQGREPTEEDIGAIIHDIGGNSQSEDWIRSAKAHAKSVLTDPKYRKDRISLDVPPDQIIRPICHEEPKKIDAYSLEELASYIVHSDDLDDSFAAEIKTNDSLRKSMATMKRRDDKRLFRQVTKIRKLVAEGGESGILTDMRNLWLDEMIKRSLLTYAKGIGPISRAVNKATSMIAGMDESCVYNDGPLDRPGYHFQLIVPQTRLRIKNLTYALLIRWGEIGDTKEIYDDEDYGDQHRATA